jgi:hypothetical protein
MLIALLLSEVPLEQKGSVGGAKPFEVSTQLVRSTMVVLITPVPPRLLKRLMLPGGAMGSVKPVEAIQSCNT